MRIIKLLLVLAILGGIALTGFAYLGDLAPQREGVSVTVPLGAPPAGGGGAGPVDGN